MIMEAYTFSCLDKHRAVTHNKGILNGIEGVCLATGQDSRAVNASLYGYAGDGPLSHYRVEGDKLFGELSVPISVGS